MGVWECRWVVWLQQVDYGRVPTDRGLPAPDRDADAAAEDPGEQERDRSVVQDAGVVHGGVPDSLRGPNRGLAVGVAVLQRHAGAVSAYHRLHHLRHALQAPLPHELRRRLGFLPALGHLLRCLRPSLLFPRGVQFLRDPVFFFDLAVGGGDPAAVVHDRGVQGHREHHCAHRAVPGVLPFLLRAALDLPLGSPGDHQAGGRRPPERTLRGLHLLLRPQQSERTHHQPAHLTLIMRTSHLAILLTTPIQHRLITPFHPSHLPVNSVSSSITPFPCQLTPSL